MKAAFLTKSGFEIREVPEPVCGPDDIIVRTGACGVCEGDVFRYKTKDNLTEDMLLGHEGTGTVYAVGENVKNFKVGEKVTSLGGAYAEYFRASPESLVKISDSSLPENVLGEPVACFVHAAERFGIREGDRVAIIGCGYMGVGCLQMAKMQGADEVVAIEPMEWRREDARQLGATGLYDPSGKDAQQILDDLGEFDVVIEATGVAPVVEICTQLVRQHGKIVFVGYHQSENGMRSVDLKTWNFKAIDVINGHVRRSDEKFEAMRKGVDLVENGKLVYTEGMVAAYDLDNVESAFGDLINRKPGLYKAVLKFDAA